MLTSISSTIFALQVPTTFLSTELRPGSGWKLNHSAHHSGTSVHPHHVHQHDIWFSADIAAVVTSGQGARQALVVTRGAWIVRYSDPLLTTYIHRLRSLMKIQRESVWSRNLMNRDNSSPLCHCIRVVCGSAVREIRHRTAQKCLTNCTRRLSLTHSEIKQWSSKNWN